MSLAQNRNNPKTVKPVVVPQFDDDEDSDDDGRKKKKGKNKKESKVENKK
jgi:hypothetical protein